MKRFDDVPGSRRKLFLAVTGSVGFAVACTCGLLGAIPSRVQSQGKNAATVAPAYEFEAASIKPNKSGLTSFAPGYTVDGYRAECVHVGSLIREAYGVQDYGLSGVPDWLRTECYDVEAKMEASVADALSKLSPDQLKLARQQMLQALLVERLNLKIHRETKEMPVYFLVIGKNGSKLHDSKPGDTHTFPGPDGGAVRGHIQIGRGNGGGQKARAFSTSMKILEEWLSIELTRSVLDRTGLTGAYDFTLEWMPDTGPTPTPDAANADSLPGIPGASICTALQQQLGLKLESGKNPLKSS